jgi:hypothetical protein
MQANEDSSVLPDSCVMKRLNFSTHILWQKCTGGTVCVRCVRLFRPCCYEATERKSRSERLEDKLQKLEHEIETLESRRTGAPPHQRGTGLGPSKERARSSTAPIQHSLPIFPEYQVEASDTSPGIVSQQDYEAGYGSAIPRTIIETSLYQWDTNTDLPPELKGYLYASVIFGFACDPCSNSLLLLKSAHIPPIPEPLSFLCGSFKIPPKGPPQSSASAFHPSRTVECDLCGRVFHWWWFLVSFRTHFPRSD